MKTCCTYFDGITSAGKPVTTELAGKQLIVSSINGSYLTSTSVNRIIIIPQLAETRWRIRLPNGGVLEIDDAEMLTQLEILNQPRDFFHLIHRLENRSRVAVASTLILVCLVAFFIFIGIPGVASIVARILPSATLDTISDQALTILDDSVFDYSRLPVEDRDVLKQQFHKLPKNDDGFRYRLLFRRGGPIGANALALPSGTIIITDELVKLLEPETELLAILLHEIAHVKHRHGLRKIIQDSTLFILFSLLTGDITSSVSIVIPNLLIVSGYSRDFEQEADLYAAQILRERGETTQAFQDALEKLTHLSRQTRQSPQWVQDWISTHPSTVERIRYLKEFDIAHP